MSWDLCILNFPKTVNRLRDLPTDWRPPPIGNRHDLIEKIQEIIPQVNFDDPSHGKFETEEYLIEIIMGDNEVCDVISLQVRGAVPMRIIFELLNHLELRAANFQTSEFFEFNPGGPFQGSLLDWR